MPDSLLNKALASYSSKQRRAVEMDQKACILIVDDDIVSRKVMKKIFHEEGFDVDIATSGEETLKKVAERSYDLILLDAMMPGMDGYETCRNLKQDKKTTDIPVIFISSLVNKEDILKSYQAGATDYIPKPADRDITIAKAKAIINTRQLNQDNDNLIRINRAVMLKLDEFFKELSILSKIDTARQEVISSSGDFSLLVEKLRGEIEKVSETLNTVETGLQFTDNISQMLNEIALITNSVHSLIYNEDNDGPRFSEKASTMSIFKKGVSQSEVDELLRSLNVKA